MECLEHWWRYRLLRLTVGQRVDEEKLCVRFWILFFYPTHLQAAIYVTMVFVYGTLHSCSSVVLRFIHGASIEKPSDQAFLTVVPFRYLIPVI